MLRLLCCFKLARIALHIRRFGDRFLPLAGVTRVRTLRIKSGLQSKPDLSLLHGDPDVTVTKVTEQGEIDCLQAFKDTPEKEKDSKGHGER